MALIKCPERGREVSDKAISCPVCGMPIAAATAENNKVKVHFERPKKLWGSAYSGEVIVDGAIVGSSGSGSSFEVMLSPGNHTVLFSSKNSMAGIGIGGFGARSDSDTLNVPSHAKAVFVTFDTKADLTGVLGGTSKIGITNVTVQ